MKDPTPASELSAVGNKREQEIRRLEEIRNAVTRDIEDVMAEYMRESGDRSLRREKIRLPHEVLDGYDLPGMKKK